MKKLSIVLILWFFVSALLLRTDSLKDAVYLVPGGMQQLLLGISNLEKYCVPFLLFSDQPFLCDIGLEISPLLCPKSCLLLVIVMLFSCLNMPLMDFFVNAATNRARPCLWMGIWLPLVTKWEQSCFCRSVIPSSTLNFSISHCHHLPFFFMSYAWIIYCPVIFHMLL